MILWYVDRMGLPGHYYSTWIRLLRDNHIPTKEILVVSLHKQLPHKQLLTRLGSRKAPTWVPEMESPIRASIRQAIASTKARAVVLSSPESLACLGLAPEHATLHALRGSVYWRDGVPHIVMLPMSAWFSMVNQKEIGAANYGFESKDEFNAARQQGAIPEGEAAEGIRFSGTLPPSGNVVPRAGGVGVAGRNDDDRELEEDDSTGVDSAGSDSDGDSGDAETDDVTEADDGEEDQFFYEPVLSPVGRFVLTADVQKLFRILRDGQNAAGPSIPIEVNYR